MSSRASRPRSASSRSRRQRLAAGAVLATTSLLGTYLAAIRPQPTYAAPNSGGAQQGDPWVSAANSGLCAIADDTTVYDDTSLRTAITQSNDDSVICIGASIQLSGPLSIDDTSLTLIGDDSSTTLTAADNSAILRVDFDNGSADDTMTLKDLTLTGADDTTVDGGALYVRGGGDRVIIDGSNFTNNIAQDGGAVKLLYVTSVISYSIFDGNSANGTGRSGGAIDFFGDTSSRVEISYSRFTNNDFSTPSIPVGNGRGGAIRLAGNHDGVSITNSYFSGNSTTDVTVSARSGGAIYSNAYESTYTKPITVADSTFLANRGYNGGAIATSFGSGLVITGSVFEDNYAYASGGAVRSYDRAQIGNSLFQGNDSDGGRGGGALFLAGYDPGGNTPASLITSSSFINNGDDTAPDNGGAVYKYYGDLNVVNSLFQGNTANNYGGGIFIADYGYDDTITYATITGNQAGTAGAGIYLSGPSPRVTVQNSILYNNEIPGPNKSDIFGQGAVSLSNSTFTSLAALSGVPTVERSVFGNPSLLGIADNGGVSIGFDDTYLPTNAPSASSIAVGLADPDLLPAVTTDQIGTSRRTPSNTRTVGAITIPGSAPTPPTPPPTFPPSAPLNITGTAGDASATITWTAPASAGSFPITDYQAVLSPGGATCLVQAPASSCTITGLTNGTPYTATARALNGAGWGTLSTPSEPFTPENPTPPPVTKTIVITGTRGTVDGRPGVYANGETTGLVGATVQARVKLAGQTDYADGSTRIVQPDGTFQWQRKTGKKVYVYFIADNGEVRSNRVIIPAR